MLMLTGLRRPHSITALLRMFLFALMALSLQSVSNAEFTINKTFVETLGLIWTDVQKRVVNQAIADWQMRIDGTNDGAEGRIGSS